ncbi:MAG: hypothetical protein CVU57_12715 [Deltaproteobacteria bacterium HGW-Deltaproteobacteria-15]|nr:MAG: hypothetical protein CVU57_12715 [Deltaproteobacteria bacterium HGW-Deltaproteobacteria-15]
MKEYGILLDTTFCTGCNSCTYRCIQEFRYHDQASRGLFRTFVQINDGGLYHKRCMHCADPECVNNCPVEALKKSEYGPVLYDAKVCVGCKTCVEVCPFGAPQFDEVTEKIVKCSLCAHRLGEGKQPACVEVCPTGAMEFGEYSVIAEKARVLSSRNGLNTYGLEEGTHLIVLSKESPISAGFPKPVKKAAKGSHVAPDRSIAVPGIAALALGGFMKFSNRMERIKMEEETKNGKERS